MSKSPDFNGLAILYDFFRPAGVAYPGNLEQVHWTCNQHGYPWCTCERHIGKNE